MKHTTHSYFLIAIIAHSIGDELCLGKDLEVRLVGPSGPSQYRGRLEVRRTEREPWGTVCNDHWNDDASSVVCYQLGLGGGKEICDHDKTTSGAIYPGGISWCTGEESSLGQCRAGQWAVQDCSHSAQVGVACEPLQDVEVRLVGLSSTKEGRVELRRSPEESWGSVCDAGWDDRDATVVCRQLGIGTTGQAKVKGFYGQGSGPVYVDHVQCRGSESNLGHCTVPPWSSGNCQHSQDAGVLCTWEAWMMKKCSSVGDCGSSPNVYCLHDKCVCTPGYVYSESLNQCIDDCSVPNLTASFTEYYHAGIHSHNRRTLHTDAEGCKQACVQETGFTCLNAEWNYNSNQCNLHSVTALTHPSSWDGASDEWIFWQRNCL